MYTAAEGPLGSDAWWQIAFCCDLIVGAACLAIGALIIDRLVRSHTVRTNKLATTAAAIFLSAGVGQGLSALKLLRPFVGASSAEIDAARVTTWWQVAWHVVVGAMIVYFLTLRKLYDRLGVAASAANDVETKRHVTELADLRASSASAEAGAEAERDSYAAMLESIIKNSRPAIYVKDLEGRYLMANASAERMFGVPEAGLVGKTDDALFDPEMATLWRANDIRGQLGSYQVEEWTDSPDGRRFLDSTKFPLYDADGTLYATCGITLDVTEPRRAAAVLAEARDEAIAATAAKSTFLATMSHEIRTPMNAVIGMTELLMDTELDDQQHEFVDTVRSSGDALLAVINDILDYSKIESGELQLESLPFNLRDEVERCLDLVVAPATAKGLDLVCHVDETCPQRVAGDVVRLRQILTNLLSNAVKFTQHGDVLVTVSTVPTDNGRLQVKVSVTDTGIGISADGVARLFKSFSQVDPSTTRVYGGTGLGLAISQRLAEAMNGGVEVFSTTAIGSTFALTVVLDTCPPLPDRHAGAGDHGSAALAGKAVLLVDDNATNRRILALQMSSWGMICTTAASGAAALATVADGLPYDVAILDMHMPHMGGVELGNALRQEPMTGDIPLVLLTSVGWRPEGVENEFAAFLSKPVKNSALRDTLVAVLTGVAPVSEPMHQRSSVLAPVPKPLRILLAEDNMVNQRVAQLMLHKLGHQVETVDNGRDAVRAVELAAYDVVLMDVQMPQMDGLEATRRIRARLPGEQQPHIVAMTASARVEDQEACAAAGMESHLSKPVRAQELQELLTRISSTAPRPNRAPAASRPDAVPITDLGLASAAPGTRLGVRSVKRDATVAPPVVSPMAIDERVLDELLLQVGDVDGQLRNDLISSYLTDGTGLVKDLASAAASGDGTKVAAIAHTWRSTSALLGAMVLAELLQQVEQVARNSPAYLSPLAALVEVEYARVEVSLANLQMGPSSSLHTEIASAALIGG